MPKRKAKRPLIPLRKIPPPPTKRSAPPSLPPPPLPFKLESLRLRIAPHLVEDLGINLYTTLARVLVEYIANAHDADATEVDVEIPMAKILEQRDSLKAEWQKKKKEARQKKVKLTRADAMALPADVAISVCDNGIGMSAHEVRDCFLVAGRRRRGKDNSEYYSAGGRLLMGRKGLGKLAGFGSAQSVAVVSRNEPATRALGIQLHYKEIAAAIDIDGIPVHAAFSATFPFVGSASGTKVEMKGLLLDPLGVTLEELREAIGEQFMHVPESEMQIRLNGETVTRGTRKHVWAWPQPELPPDSLVLHSYEVDGETFSFHYRLRFVEDKKALPASRRGVSVFSHRRLAAEPSLMKADTNMHGFRMTDYLDGVVYADFIDEQTEDYISTDRQSLRWETPLLSPMRDFISEQIKKACAERQSQRDKVTEGQARRHDATKQLVQEADLTRGEQTLAYQCAGLILANCKQGIDDPVYFNRVEQVVKGLGRGRLLTTLSDMAQEAEPEFEAVVTAMTKLTSEQLDSFYRFVRGRVDGLEALRRIVDSVTGGAHIPEAILQRLFSQNPWLLDARYFQYVTSDRRNATLFRQLENELEINRPVPTEDLHPRREPDLTFILGSLPLGQLVIVELKAPSLPLLGKHFQQLQGYVRSAQRFLERQGLAEKINVSGHLVGTIKDPKSEDREVQRDYEWLVEQIVDRSEHRENCLCRTLNRVLLDAQAANKELLDSWKDSFLLEGEQNGTGDDAA